MRCAAAAARPGLRPDFLHEPFDGLEIGRGFQGGDPGVALNLPHQSAQHRARTHFNIRADASRRKPARRPLPTAPAPRPAAPAPRSPPPVGLRLAVDVGDDRHRGCATRPAPAVPAPGDPAPAASARSGTARSPAAAITRLAPRALARSPARCTAATVPAMTTWPGALRLAGATTSPSAASAQAAATWSPSRPSTAAIAPCAHRHGLLHVPPAPPHDAARHRQRRTCRPRRAPNTRPGCAPRPYCGRIPRSPSNRAAATLTVRIAGWVFSVSTQPVLRTVEAQLAERLAQRRIRLLEHGSALRDRPRPARGPCRLSATPALETRTRSRARSPECAAMPRSSARPAVARKPMRQADGVLAPPLPTSARGRR